MSDILPDGRAFEAYRDEIQAYRERQGLKPVSQTDARLLFEQAARQIPCEPPPVTVSEHADDDEAFRLGLLAHVKAGYDAQRDLLRVRWELAVWLRPYVQPGGDRRSSGFQDGTGSGLKKHGTGSGVSDQDGTGSGLKKHGTGSGVSDQDGTGSGLKKHGTGSGVSDQDGTGSGLKKHGTGSGVSDQDGTGSGLKKHGTGSGVSDQDGTGSGFSAYAVFEEMRAAGKVSIRWSSLLRYLPLAEHDWKTITEHAHTVKGALKWCADFKRTPEEREAAKYARRDTRADHDRRTEGHIREIRTLNREVARLQDEVDTDLAAEVAKLRAQVSGLKTDIQAKDRQIARLRKDAAHHRLSARGGPLKEVGATPQWCSKCANPPSDCECGSVPEVTANGNGAGRADLFAHAVVSLPGEEAAT